MIEKPSDCELKNLFGEETFRIWEKLIAEIEARYDLNAEWNTGGKAWKYAYRYQKSGKTLYGLYAREGGAGFMIIFGGSERTKVERIKDSLLEKTAKIYDDAQIYHDGKWVMFPFDETLISDYLILLGIKRKPDKA